MTLQSENTAASIASFFRLDVVTGIHVFDEKVIKLETGENGEIRLVTPKIKSGNIPQKGAVLAIQNEEGKVEWEVKNQLPIKTITSTYSATENDCTICLDATTASFSLHLPDATKSEGLVYNLLTKHSNVNFVEVRSRGGNLVQGSEAKVNISMVNAPDVRSFQSDGKDWILIARY
ncbi:MAG: hypothetical protein NXI23_14540 [Bacteroidetes bacterium]|nr:hypothetical protein [Bacteroidota bacterium]MDF1863622.1 hypothetical protein [Saprospiraceae bacterium]